MNSTLPKIHCHCNHTFGKNTGSRGQTKGEYGLLIVSMCQDELEQSSGLEELSHENKHPESPKQQTSHSDLIRKDS